MREHPAQFQANYGRCRQLAADRGNTYRTGTGAGGTKDFVQACMKGKQRQTARECQALICEKLHDYSLRAAGRHSCKVALDAFPPTALSQLQHTCGLSPTSQFSPSGGAGRNARGAGM